MSHALTAAAPALSLDPFSDSFCANPYPGHTQVRETAPIIWLSRYNCFGAGRHADVKAIFSDPITFCSSRGAGLTDYAKNPPYRPPSIILEADPPSHTRTRAVLTKVLSPAVIKTLRETFTTAAQSLVKSLPPTCDAIASIAEAFPLSVFPDAVGLTKTGRENLLPYGNFVFNSMGPQNQPLKDSLAILPPILEWLSQQVRRPALTPTGLGAVIYQAADRNEITQEEAALLVRSLLSAGLDTTINGIGAALYSFARFPRQWTLLRENPSLARNAFEEAIRYESPVQTFFRTTTTKTELSGTAIPEGEKILMFLAAANRDPRRWENPDSFDITRQTAGHVGFGAGIHMCVGQLLARLEGEVLLAALAEKITRIELTAEPIRQYNNTLRGLASMPVKLHTP